MMKETNIETKGAMEAMKQVAEAIPTTTNSKLNIILGATAVIVTGVTVVTGAVMGIRHLGRKKKLKEEQDKAAASGVDNVQVAKDHFEEKDSAEE